MTDTRKDGGPAFPTEPNTQPGVYVHHGMTLRDWFAGQALAAIGTWTPGELPFDLMYGTDEWHQWSISRRASYAYRQADAMLAERSK